MAVKTRLEILEKDYSSALDQLIENEINLISLERRMIATSPGKDYDALQASIVTKKNNIKQIKDIVEVIDELIKKEGK